MYKKYKHITCMQTCLNVVYLHEFHGDSHLSILFPYVRPGFAEACPANEGNDWDRAVQALALSKGARLGETAARLHLTLGNDSGIDALDISEASRNWVISHDGTAPYMLCVVCPFNTALEPTVLQMERDLSQK